MQINHSNNQRGFTLLETLFYAAGLVILLLAMSAFLYYMYDWYQRVTLGPRVDRIGINLTDRLIKDIRSGTTVNAAQSIFNSDNGALSLTAEVNSAIVTKYFALTNGRLMYQENSGAASYLTPANLTVSKLYIVSTSTPVSEGATFAIDIQYSSRNGTTTQTYSGFSLLRQSY